MLRDSQKRTEVLVHHWCVCVYASIMHMSFKWCVELKTFKTQRFGRCVSLAAIMSVKMFRSSCVQVVKIYNTFLFSENM